MKRRSFLLSAIPALALFARCNDKSETNPDEAAADDSLNRIELLFPSAKDALISGALNPVRFNNPSGRAVNVLLFDANGTEIFRTSGVSEASVLIPMASTNTAYTLQIDSVKFSTIAEVVNAHPFPVHASKSALAEGKTIGVYNTNGIPFAVKQTSDKQWLVLNLTCTHNGCMVNVDEQSGFVCGCHGSRFSQSGAVLQGPAEQNLSSFPFSYLPLHEILLVWNS